MFKKYLAIAALALLTACAQLGVPTPQNLDQQLLAAQASATALRTTATTLLTAKKIGSADAQNVQAQADNIVAGVTIGRSLVPVDPAAANAKLQQISAGLLALQTYLATKETPK